MSHKPYQFSEGSMSNPNPFRSPEADAIFRIGVSNPIVSSCKMAFERGECTWEQALVAMVTALDAALTTAHLEQKKMIEYVLLQKRAVTLERQNEEPQLVEPIVRPRTKGR